MNCLFVILVVTTKIKCFIFHEFHFFVILLILSYDNHGDNNKN